jgi:hypothetical protein
MVGLARGDRLAWYQSRGLGFNFPRQRIFFRCARSSTPSPPSPTFLPLCPRSLATPFGASNAIMDASLITPPTALFSSHSVQCRMLCPYTSPQNGKIERMIRTTNDVMRLLLFQASLPACYWAKSLYTATYILNLLPTKAISAPTPYFALFGTTPSYAHLQVFGCACYPNTSVTAPHKLASRSYRCVFLGYSSDHKGTGV